MIKRIPHPKGRGFTMTFIREVNCSIIQIRLLAITTNNNNDLKQMGGYKCWADSLVILQGRSRRDKTMIDGGTEPTTKMVKIDYR